LPIFPALALLIASFLEHAKARSWAIAAGMLAVLGIAGLATLPYLAKMGDEPIEIASYQAWEPWIVAACVVMLAGAACVFFWIKQKRTDLATVATLALAISGFLAGQLLILGYDDFGRYKASVSMLPAIQAELTLATTLYAIGTYEQSLPFYLRRTMTTVGETNDELDFGLKQEPNLGIATINEFILHWNNGQKALAIVSPDVYNGLKKLGVPMRVVAQDPRRVVIANDVR